MAGGKYRSFLVHIKAVSDSGMEESPRPERVATGKTEGSAPSKKVENLRGCDLLQEVSVTIRKFKKTSVPKERYGLYSSPFDPVLFDLEVSGSSCKNAFNSSIGVQSDEIDLSEILSGRSWDHILLQKCLSASF
ncbi:Baculoviral IAP repeat-containing protein 6 [Xenoophorus captivus]|uniref:Baculoviral IAP repeat-containing protein 6 n=1 Tax=Xenoophorus captivus TaxID=1517983 RepID=A0ABV0R4W6_9TELE